MTLDVLTPVEALDPNVTGVGFELVVDAADALVVVVGVEVLLVVVAVVLAVDTFVGLMDALVGSLAERML